MIFLNTPNNPTGQLIPLDDLERIAAAAPHAVVLIDEAYIEFGGAVVPAASCRSYPERAGRPDVLEGLRPRRHARRHRHRPAAGARSGPRGDAAVQHQRRGAGRHARGARGHGLPAALRRAGRASRASGSMRRAARLGLEFWESAANFVLVRVGDAAPLVRAGAGRAQACTSAIARRIRRRPAASAITAGIARAHRRARSRRSNRSLAARQRSDEQATTRGRRRSIAQTTETQITGALTIDGDGPLRRPHRHPLLRPHARAVHAPRRLRPDAARHGRPRRRSAPHRRRRRHRARRGGARRRSAIARASTAPATS